MTRKDANLAVAKFLQMNYRGRGKPWAPWDDVTQDERDAWLCEASAIVHIVREELPRGDQ